MIPVPGLTDKRKEFYCKEIVKGDRICYNLFRVQQEAVWGAEKTWKYL